MFVCGGCSNEYRPGDLPPLFPVTLTILRDGQPLDHAMVTLYTENPSIVKWTIGGETDADGKAVIVTHGQFHGAPAGAFKVCVLKREYPQIPAERDAAPMPSVGGAIPQAGPIPPPIDLVDPLFFSPESTPLEIEIPRQKKGVALTLNVHAPKK